MEGASNTSGMTLVLDTIICLIRAALALIRLVAYVCLISP